jgi:hypothetical protein
MSKERGHASGGLNWIENELIDDQMKQHQA